MRDKPLYPLSQLKRRLQHGWAIMRRDSFVPALPRGATMVGIDRLLAIERHLRVIARDRIPGDVVECGVAAGGTSALMGLWLDRQRTTGGQSHQRRQYLFDTFEGLPPPTADDPDASPEWIGQCRGTLEDVTALLRGAGLDMSRLQFVRGLFQDTIPHPGLKQIALLHLDGDWYESTRHCLQHLWPLVSPGGRVQIDDYGTWQGCRKAVDEFLAHRPEVEPRWIDDHGVWIAKPH